jgi:hypothetical protein
VHNKTGQRIIHTTGTKSSSVNLDKSYSNAQRRSLAKLTTNSTVKIS